MLRARNSKIIDAFKERSREKAKRVAPTGAIRAPPNPRRGGWAALQVPSCPKYD